MPFGIRDQPNRWTVRQDPAELAPRPALADCRGRPEQLPAGYAKFPNLLFDCKQLHQKKKQLKQSGFPEGLHLTRRSQFKKKTMIKIRREKNRKERTMSQVHKRRERNSENPAHDQWPPVDFCNVVLFPIKKVDQVQSQESLYRKRIELPCVRSNRSQPSVRIACI